jgi:dihydropteroate synthase
MQRFFSAASQNRDPAFFEQRATGTPALQRTAPRSAPRCAASGAREELDSPDRTAQSDGMIATTSRPVPADHPVLPALLSRPYPAVMGVLNVTPDSFSDGGQFIAPEDALAQARRMIAEGADIIDIGAESTRPYGAQPISVEDELQRLQPVLGRVVSLGTPVSIDSMKSAVVAWALEAGARIANDVWGLQRDPDMAKVVAAHRVPVILMHNRDHADAAIDIIRDIEAFFARSLDIAARAGIPGNHIVLDPGIGFGKTPEQSITVLARLDELREFGLPLLIGASRKRFISTIMPSEPHQRLGGSIAAHVLAARKGARIVRAHDVAETVQALRVAAAIEVQR